MKHILLLSALALVATITPHTNASPTAPPDPSFDIPHSAFVIAEHTPDFDLGLQMFCTAPELEHAAFEVLRVSESPALPVFTILRPEDALEAPQPLLTAILTRREAASIRKAPWHLYRYRPADPASA